MTHASTSMTYEFTARTDKGRVRSNNEDAVAVDRDAQVAISVSYTHLTLPTIYSV